MAIIRLSESTINLIAAGEVVERPASVVKELLENSIDAGATSIDIYLEESGKNLITISDDGGGMSKDDMLIAIQRHTTSKLDESDILNIRSFGFRGEALSSICSVSRFSITSKLSSKTNESASNIAFELLYEAGKVSINQALHNQGTKIQVRDLFYSIPARLKFLKSNQTELSLCMEVIKRLALTTPHITYCAHHNKHLLLKIPKASSIKDRIRNILSQNFEDNAIEVSFSENGINVYGYIGMPTHHRASSDEQFVFVNNRPVKDQLIASCIKVAYQDYIVQGRFPAAVLFIEVPFTMVDVNVHPAKTQVRFQDSAIIRSSIIRALKAALSSKELGVSNTLVDKAFSYFTAPAKPTESASLVFDEKVYYKPQESEQTSFNVKHEAVVDSVKLQAADQSCVQTQVVLQSIKSENQEFELGNACAQLHNNYIIAQTNKGIVIVDQHAAHERIVYEDLKEHFAQQALKSQQLLVPIVVELSMHKATCLMEHKDDLKKLALLIERMNDIKIVVQEVPSILVNSNITQLILDIADEITQDDNQMSLSKWQERIIETYACHRSIRSGQKLSPQEMNALLRQMEKTPGASQCCHGRPTYVKLSLNDMEKLFSRK